MQPRQVLRPMVGQEGRVGIKGQGVIDSVIEHGRDESSSAGALGRKREKQKGLGS